MAPIAIDTPFTAPLKPNPPSASAPSSLFHHTKAQPLATSAQGLYYTLEDGRTVLDAVSGGAAVACLGNGNDEIVDTMTEQARKMGYSYHQVLSNGPSGELADYLCNLSGGKFEAAAFFSSGSEAMEAALKLSRQYWVEKGEPQRKYVIGRNPSYHGNTLGALAVGYVKGRRDIFEPLIATTAFHHVTSPTYKRSHQPNESEESYSHRLAIELDLKITELGAENVIGFFAEPVVGAALGVMPPPKGYFPSINAIIQKHGILLIMDEVMSGSGRCGEIFAHEAVGEGVVPDIMSMAKGLGGGYVTISGLLVNKKVADVVRQGGQWKNSHTYQGHPINCAVALKVMKIIERDQLMVNVRQRGEQILKELRQGFEGLDIVFDVRGAGLFIGVEFDVPSSLNPRFSARVRAEAFKNGLLTLPLAGIIDGVNGDSITLAPAYNVTAEQVSEIVRLLVKSVKQCAAEL